MITVLTLNPSVDRSYRLEEFGLGRVQRAKQVIATAGGKGLNVARVISSLGGTVNCLGFLGGFTGSFIRQELSLYNIIDYFTTIQGTSRICLNLRDGQGISTEVLESGPEILPEEMLCFEQQLRELLRQTTILVASGSLAKGIPVDYYRALAQMCKDAKVKFLLDCSGASLRLAMTGRPFLIKPNEEELEAITGVPIKTVDDAFRGAELLLQMGAENVCLSLGERGMILAGSLGRFVVRVPAVRVVNAVGCGDSLVSGLAYALDKKYEIIEALQFANGCALSNALQEGVGEVKREQVESFAGAVTVQAYVPNQI